MITPHATDTCSQKPRTARPHTSPAPSLLGAAVDRIPQTRRGTGSLRTSGEKGLTGRQLGTLAFHHRIASVGVGMPAVALRQSRRASTPFVRLGPLPAHVSRAPRAPRAAPAPPFRTGSARPPSTRGGRAVSNGPKGGGGADIHTSSVVVPTGRGMTSAVPGSSSGAPPLRGGGLPHSEHPSERAVVERTIDAL